MRISLLKETKAVGAGCYKYLAPNGAKAGRPFRTFEFDDCEPNLSLFVCEAIMRDVPSLFKSNRKVSAKNEDRYRQ